MGLGAKRYYCSRGRVALSLWLKSLNKNHQEHVLIQSYTCEAVPEAVFESGLVPVYVDIELESFSMSFANLVALNCAPTRVSALVLQHTFGITPRDRLQIIAFCHQNSIEIIEDYCHVPWHDAVNFPSVSDPCRFVSFEWGKPVPLGIGGALLVAENDEKIEVLDSRYYEFLSPKRNIRFILEFLMFQVTNNRLLSGVVRRVAGLGKKLGMIQGNFGIKKSEYQMKAPAILVIVAERALRTTIFRPASLDNSIEDQLLEACPKLIFAGNHRCVLKVTDKDKAQLLGDHFGLAVSTWFISPVHPRVSKEDLLEMNYSEDQKNALIASDTLVSFRAPVCYSECGRLRRFYKQLELDNLLISV